MVIALVFLVGSLVFALAKGYFRLAWLAVTHLPVVLLMGVIVGGLDHFGVFERYGIQSEGFDVAYAKQLGIGLAAAVVLWVVARQLRRCAESHWSGAPYFAARGIDFVVAVAGPVGLAVAYGLYQAKMVSLTPAQSLWYTWGAPVAAAAVAYVYHNWQFTRWSDGDVPSRRTGRVEAPTSAPPGEYRGLFSAE